MGLPLLIVKLTFSLAAELKSPQFNQKAHNADLISSLSNYLQAE